MSTSTHFYFLNANDPDFVAAKNGTDEERQDWEISYGRFEDTPGSLIEHGDEVIEETDAEYGGWIIPVSAIPKDATHIKIERF